MTNADRIRQMTDEQLAQWLTDVETIILAVNPNMSHVKMLADWLVWLKQDVEEVEE